MPWLCAGISARELSLHLFFCHAFPPRTSLHVTGRDSARPAGIPSCSPCGAPDLAGVAPSSSAYSSRTHSGLPAPPTEDPSNSWQLGACVALGDPLASCLLLASVHQPSEGGKHLQEPACLAPLSGSLPSSLPPPDLPYPAPFFPQDAPLSPPCH